MALTVIDTLADSQLGGEALSAGVVAALVTAPTFGSATTRVTHSTNRAAVSITIEARSLGTAASGPVS